MNKPDYKRHQTHFQHFLFWQIISLANTPFKNYSTKQMIANICVSINVLWAGLTKSSTLILSSMKKRLQSLGWHSEMVQEAMWVLMGTIIVKTAKIDLKSFTDPLKQEENASDGPVKPSTVTCKATPGQNESVLAFPRELMTNTSSGVTTFPKVTSRKVSLLSLPLSCHTAKIWTIFPK